MADEPALIPPPVVRDPYCVCGSVMRLFSVNRSTTEVTGDPETLITVRQNFRCYGCHNTAVFQIDSGDDPRGYTRL